jgi:hypothetical protein
MIHTKQEIIDRAAGRLPELLNHTVELEHLRMALVGISIAYTTPDFHEDTTTNKPSWVFGAATNALHGKDPYEYFPPIVRDILSAAEEKRILKEASEDPETGDMRTILEKNKDVLETIQEAAAHAKSDRWKSVAILGINQQGNSVGSATGHNNDLRGAMVWMLVKLCL